MKKLVLLLGSLSLLLSSPFAIAKGKKATTENTAKDGQTNPRKEKKGAMETSAQTPAPPAEEAPKSAEEAAPSGGGGW